MLNSDSYYEKMDRLLNDDEFEQKYLDESEAVYDKKYKALSLEETIDRSNRAKLSLSTRLTKYLVKPHQNISTEKSEGLASIIGKATDERPFQNFLKENPFFLTRKIHPAHHYQLCISEPQLGCQFRPDFLIAGLDSGGLWWYGVELESPKYAMFTKEGEQTSKLSHALRQIDDWRSWLRRNIRYAQDELGYTDIDADLPCFLIIGKRDNEVLGKKELKLRSRELQKRDRCGLFFHHYEHLLDDSLTLVETE